MRVSLSLMVLVALFGGCSADYENAYEPDVSISADAYGAGVLTESEIRNALRERLNHLEIEPLTGPPPTDEALVTLGHSLFFDPILSGPKDTNCVVCHQMDKGTADAVPLSAGTGAIIDEYGDRRPGPELAFTPRNSLDLFNRGHQDLHTMFWDRRMEKLDDGRFVVHERSYAHVEGNYLRIMPDGLNNLLAAQTMLPPLDRDELRGIHGSVDIFGDDNELARIPDHDLEGSWERLIRRVVDVAEYRDLLRQAYPGTDIDDMTFVHVANALSAFIIDAFTLPDSPWNRFVAGEDQALTSSQLRGAYLFYESGEAGCASCHGGALLTDQQIYNFAVPPMTRGPEPLNDMDLGAAHRSHAGPEADFFFRTPSLHNVALTGPYMHNGAYSTLEAVIRHKIDPVDSLWNYDLSHLAPAFQEQVHSSPEQLERVHRTVSPQALVVPFLSDDEIDDLVAFLKSLTSPRAQNLDHLELETVPSGLPIPEL